MDFRSPTFRLFSLGALRNQCRNSPSALQSDLVVQALVGRPPVGGAIGGSRGVCGGPWGGEPAPGVRQVSPPPPRPPVPLRPLVPCGVAPSEQETAPGNSLGLCWRCCPGRMALCPHAPTQANEENEDRAEEYKLREEELRELRAELEEQGRQSNALYGLLQDQQREWQQATLVRQQVPISLSLSLSLCVCVSGTHLSLSLSLCVCVCVCVESNTPVTVCYGCTVCSSALHALSDWTLGAAAYPSEKLAMTVRRHTKVLADGEG